jgi:hypothetical protein
MSSTRPTIPSKVAKSSTQQEVLCTTRTIFQPVLEQHRNCAKALPETWAGRGLRQVHTLVDEILNWMRCQVTAASGIGQQQCWSGDLTVPRYQVRFSIRREALSADLHQRFRMGRTVIRLQVSIATVHPDVAGQWTINGTSRVSR